MNRYLSKFGYQITIQKILEIEKAYLQDLNSDVTHIKISMSDWEDFKFTVRYRTNLYIQPIKFSNEMVSTRLIPLINGLEFEVIKQITKKNHIWLMEDIGVGKVLKYSSSSVYGSINRYQGLPLEVGEAICQINFDYIRIM